MTRALSVAMSDRDCLPAIGRDCPTAEQCVRPTDRHKAALTDAKRFVIEPLIPYPAAIGRFRIRSGWAALNIVGKSSERNPGGARFSCVFGHSLLSSRNSRRKFRYGLFRRLMARCQKADRRERLLPLTAIRKTADSRSESGWQTRRVWRTTRTRRSGPNRPPKYCCRFSAKRLSSIAARSRRSATSWRDSPRPGRMATAGAIPVPMIARSVVQSVLQARRPD